MADIRQRIVIDAVDNTTKGVRSAQRNASALETTLTRLRATLLGFVGLSIGADIIRNLSRISDEAIELTAKLKLTTDSVEEFNGAFSTLFDLSTKTGTSFEANVTLFNRLRIAFSSAGSDAQDFALNLTEVLNNSLRISGASAQESASTIRQFSQAMASGVLRGEEFNAIMENSPRLVQALTDSLGVTVGELRSLSKEGRLSAEVVRDAILDQQDAIAAQAAQLPLTIGRSIENVRTAYTAWVSQFSEGNAEIAGKINFLAENFDELAQAVESVVKVSGLYFSGKALQAITTRSATFLAAKEAELTAYDRELAAQKRNEVATLASARVRAAAAAEETKKKLEQAAIEAKIAANRKAQAAEEELAAAQAAVVQAKRTAALKQYEKLAQDASLKLQALRQQEVIAEKEAAVEIAVAREELRQKKLIASKEEQLQIEARQLQRAEEAVQEKQLAVESAALREQRRQEEAFDAAQRKKNAEAEKIRRAEALVEERRQIEAERQASIERAELREIERQKREAIAIRKKELANIAIGDNKREALSIEELIAKMGIQFKVNQDLVAQASAKQRASLENAQSKTAEAEATLRNIKAGETEQAQIREGFVLNKEAIAQAQASAAADLEQAVAKRDLIAAAQAEGLTLAELTAKRKAENLSKIESSALDKERIAAVRAAAEQEAIAARQKLEAINLAREQGITVAQATKQIQAQTAATIEQTAVDRKAVLAATEKERARLAEARSARDAAKAEVEKAAATTASNKATFEATELTGKLTFAQQVAAEKTRINAAAKAEDTTSTKANSTATKENTVATEANNVALGLGTTLRKGKSAATAADTAATTANTAATAANSVAQAGLVGQVKEFLTKKRSIIPLLDKISPKLSSFALGGVSLFKGLVGVVGRVGSALLGWPGILAYVGYEVSKYFIDWELYGQALLNRIREIGTAFLNLFRGEDEAKAAIEANRKAYSEAVDDILEKRRLQAAGFKDAAEEEAAIAQELQDKLNRLENERGKKIDERANKYVEYISKLEEFEQEERDARAATTEALADALDTELALERAQLAKKVEDKEEFDRQFEELQKDFEKKKIDLTIESAEKELGIATELSAQLATTLQEGSAKYQEQYSARLAVQREANAALVSSVESALKQAATEEERYLGIARSAAEQRKRILKDFNDAKSRLLDEELTTQEKFYKLLAEKRDANRKLAEADQLKQKGQFDLASKLFEQASNDLIGIAEDYKTLSQDQDVSARKQNEAARLLKVTVNEAGRAANRAADAQKTIEDTANRQAKLQADRQRELTLKLDEYKNKLTELDAVIAKDRTIRIDLDTNEVLRSIDRIDAAIKGLSQTITITTRQVQENQLGGMIFKRQTGGDIPDPKKFVRRKNKVPGSGSGDIVPAMLEPGEFIIRKSSVQKYGADMMDKLNRGELPGFNTGGLVSSPQVAAQVLSKLQGSGLDRETTRLIQDLAKAVGGKGLPRSDVTAFLDSAKNLISGEGFGDFDKETLIRLIEKNSIQSVTSSLLASQKEQEARKKGNPNKKQDLIDQLIAAKAERLSVKKDPLREQQEAIKAGGVDKKQEILDQIAARRSERLSVKKDPLREQQEAIKAGGVDKKQEILDQIAASKKARTEEAIARRNKQLGKEEPEEGFDFFGKVLRFARGGFLGGSNGKKIDLRGKVLEDIINALGGSIAQLQRFEQKKAAQWTRGNGLRRMSGGYTPGGKQQYYDYLTLKANANVGEEFLPKFRNLDPTKFNIQQMRALRSAVGVLLSNGVTGGLGIGAKGAAQLIGERNAAVAAAKETIEQILGAAGGSSGFSKFAFATGGDVPGFGTGDTVRAMLTPGEYVINRKAVEKFGAGFFDNLNRGTLPQKFANGGLVGGNTKGETINVNLTIGGKSATGTFQKDNATMAILDELKKSGAVS